MNKIIFFLVFILLLSSCFAEQRKIEGLTDEIYKLCSGVWTMEKYIENVQTVGMQTSWGRATGGQRGFSLIIDLRSETDINIWPPDMGSLVVKSVDKIDAETVKIFVDKFRISSKIKIEESKPLENFIIILHFIDKDHMWIDSEVSNEKGGGSLIIYDGSEYIYTKVSGPDIEPLFTEKSDEKELISPP